MELQLCCELPLSAAVRGGHATACSTVHCVMEPSRCTLCQVLIAAIITVSLDTFLRIWLDLAG
jgi:hypothetical protein